MTDTPEPMLTWKVKCFPDADGAPTYDSEEDAVRALEQLATTLNVGASFRKISKTEYLVDGLQPGTYIRLSVRPTDG